MSASDFERDTVLIACFCLNSALHLPGDVTLAGPAERGGEQ